MNEASKIIVQLQEDLQYARSVSTRLLKERVELDKRVAELESLLKDVSILMECYHGVDTNEINELLEKKTVMYE